MPVTISNGQGKKIRVCAYKKEREREKMFTHHGKRDKANMAKY